VLMCFFRGWRRCGLSRVGEGARVAGQMDAPSPKNVNMSRVEEIEDAILALSPEEFARISRRIQDIEQERWDQQMDQDASAGKLDFLREEGRSEREQGLLRDWPQSS